MGIKRTKWDKVFSNYIRERDHWTCQRCLTISNKNNPNSRKGLHCSHYVGRASWSTRIEPANAMALCYGCHRYLTAHPSEHKELWKIRFSAKERKRIKDRKNARPNIQKKHVATEEYYQQLKQMLRNMEIDNEWEDY